MKRFAAALLGFALVLVGVSPAHAFVDKDCGDFATQQEAQDFYIASGVGDPHRLDGNDNDGQACESLPCPCMWDVTSAPPTVVSEPTTVVADPAAVAAKSVGTVVKIVDGDTIDVKIAGVKHRIRVLGIDTPEVFNGVECGGKQASKAMKSILKVGAKVTLKGDASQADIDRYDRLLRYVFKGSTDVGLSLVKKGWARPYIYKGNPFARAGSYKKAGAKAERAGRGVWDRCGGF
jgi:endonuclease YncB( thermonuclease family)